MKLLWIIQESGRNLSLKQTIHALPNCSINTRQIDFRRYHDSALSYYVWLPKPTNTHNSTSAYSKASNPDTCFCQSCGHPQWGALQWINGWIYQDIFNSHPLYRTSLKMAIRVAGTCSRNTGCVIYFHTLTCKCWFWYHVYVVNGLWNVGRPR